MTVIIQEIDNTPLLMLPTWVPGSLRTAGYSRSLWYSLWNSIGQAQLPVLNAVIDFGNVTIAQWTGEDSAESEFLSYWTPTLSGLRTKTSGLETNAERLERLLTFRTLINAPFPETEYVLGWALTAAFGLATRSQCTMSTIPAGAFVPTLQSYANIEMTLDNTEDPTLSRRQELGDTTLMLASQPFWRRGARPGSSGSRYSPWGRAQSMPLLRQDLQPLGNAEISIAVKDIQSREKLYFSFPSRQYDKSVRPGLYGSDVAVEVLTSSHPIIVRTTIDAMRYGDTDLRVPGGRIPSPRWRQAVAPIFAPSWKESGRRDYSSIAPPFDLDTDLIQPLPSSALLYGTGLPVSGLPMDHPLAVEYA